MDGYLEKLGYDFLDKTIDLPAELEAIINLEFLTDNDCIILKSWYGHDENPALGTDLEKSIWEDDETHFHPDAYVPEGSDEIEYLACALECAKRLMLRLQKEFPSRPFRISVSFDETTYETEDPNEINSYGSSTVRFHQIRPTTEYTMYTDDLNDFKLNAVLEIEI